MKQGELVLIDYVGRTGGEIFDLTVEEKAKEEGVYQEDVNYEPVPVLVGHGYVIEGLEEAIEDMEVGDEEELTISAEKAYGKRKSENVETYPEKEFNKQDVNVRRGERVMIGNRQGRVVSKGSGRVRIDFNHPLAGKELDYWVKVVEKVDDDEEIAKHVYSHRVGHAGESLEFEDGVVKIEKSHSHGDHVHELPEQVQETITEDIEENTDLEVEFVE